MTAILETATEDDPLRPHEIEELARRSGGNPLFLFQLLEMVRTTGTIEALPDSIESLIAGEIDQLAPADRTILRYASVLGTTRRSARCSSTASATTSSVDDEIWIG